MCIRDSHATTSFLSIFRNTHFTLYENRNQTKNTKADEGDERVFVERLFVPCHFAPLFSKVIELHPLKCLSFCCRQATNRIYSNSCCTVKAIHLLHLSLKKESKYDKIKGCIIFG